MSMLDKALAKVKDYQTQMIVKLRYRRLRQYREDSFRFVGVSSGAIAAETRELQANYLPVNSGKGTRTIFDPTRDRVTHIIPAGLYRAMGEHSYPPEDPRLSTAMGENLMELHFFALRDELKRRMEKAQSKKAGQAAYASRRGPWIEVKENDRRVPRRPITMRLLLDPNTHLPQLLEYTDFDDDKAFLVVEFNNTEINKGISAQDLWK